jgi:hypothetical protein
MALASATPPASSSSTLPERNEHGELAREGAGTWEHWAALDPQRFNTLKMNAVRLLYIRFQCTYEQTDSDDGEETQAERSRVMKKKTFAALHGWGDYATYEEDFEAGAIDPFIESVLRPDVRRRAMAVFSLNLPSSLSGPNVQNIAQVSKSCSLLVGTTIYKQRVLQNAKHRASQ